MHKILDDIDFVTHWKTREKDQKNSWKGVIDIDIVWGDENNWKEESKTESYEHETVRETKHKTIDENSF